MDASRGERLVAVDALRGLVMVLMALDHVRDFYGILADPHDVANASPALFLTRWVTHLCAPTFVLLAGTGAWMYGTRSGSRARLSRFLWTRGLWLVVLELTVVTHAWLGVVPSPVLVWQVIGAIGTAMVALALLVRLPHAAIAAVAVLVVVGHGLLDPVRPEGPVAAGLWRFLHQGAMDDFALVSVLGQRVLVLYPVLPWIGVLTLGYALGPLLALERQRRRRALARLGLATTLAFLAVRGANGYGDPAPWSVQQPAWRTALSFLDADKYPPSLAFLLMTLGPALLFLALLDREPAEEPGRYGRVRAVLATYGRVPLFYYVAHLYLVRWSSELVHLLRTGEPVSMVASALAFLGPPLRPFPEGFAGLPLPAVWAAWIAIVAALYPACRWYAGVKRRSRSRLLSYL